MSLAGSQAERKPVGAGRAIVLACLFFIAGCSDSEEVAPAQSDFTVLAQEAEGFLQAEPGTQLEFPRDHGPHPGFRIEWWYLTANLEDARGLPYGAQWTLFRYQTRLSEDAGGTNPWQSEQLYMAHFAVTTPGGHQAAQRYARGGVHGGTAQAGARAAPFSAWLDDWAMTSTGSQWLPLQVTARDGRVAMALELEATGPLILQGQSGFSQKHPDGGGSYYYSQPFIRASGTLEVDGEVIAVTGDAWIDREWSSQFLQDDQAGWDWFSLHLESGEKVMLFRLRGREGTGATGDFQYGSLFAPDGTRIDLDPSRIITEELHYETVAGRRLPIRWRIDLPAIDRQFEVNALHADQWMDLDYPYWEGVITVAGASPGSRGRGYLEMTGY